MKLRLIFISTISLCSTLHSIPTFKEFHKNFEKMPHNLKNKYNETDLFERYLTCLHYSFESKNNCKAIMEFVERMPAFIIKNSSNYDWWMGIAHQEQRDALKMRDWIRALLRQPNGKESAEKLDLLHEDLRNCTQEPTKIYIDVKCFCKSSRD